MKICDGKYYDMNGNEIREDDYVMMNGKKMRVYLTEDGELGTDATNPAWITSGRAYPTEYGIYPFNENDEPALVDN